MARVFISHASPNAGHVRFLGRALEAVNHRVIFTGDLDKGLPASEEWLDTIEQGLRISDAVVFWITDDWIRSCWCRMEYVFARRLGVDCLFFKDPKAKFELIATKQIYETSIGTKLATELTLLFAGQSATIKETEDPYPGFEAYDERLSRFYCGRQEATKDLTTWAKTYKTSRPHKPLRALYGSSGVGKTSLLRAGVYATLLSEEERLDVGLEKTRKWLRTSARAVHVKKPRRLEIATAFDPTENPQQSVRRCLARLVGRDDEAAVRGSIDMGLLQAEVIERYQGSRDDYGYARGVILIDAFERFYQGADGPAARQTLHSVATQCRINVLFSVRSSALSALVEDEVLKANLHLEQVREIDPEAFPEIIERPAERCGWTVKSDLTEVLSSYFREHSQSLPLIAYVMRAVWRARLADGDAIRHRALTRQLLDRIAGSSAGTPTNPIDNLIQGLCLELEADLDGRLTVALEDVLFRMCRWDEAGQEVSSVGCAIRPGSADEERLVQLLTSAKYRLMTREARGGEEIVRPTHDRVLHIWPRAKTILGELRSDLLVRSMIETELGRALRTGGDFRSWMASLPGPDVEQVGDFFRDWLEHLDDKLQEVWRKYDKASRDRGESTVRTRRLLHVMGAHRAVAAGILADLKLANGDPCQAVQVALAAPDISARGKPYKSVVTALMRGLHDLRELNVWNAGGEGKHNHWLFGGTWDDENQTVSAFKGGQRIIWGPNKEITLVDILPSNHSAIRTLTDGGWGCVLSAREQTEGVLGETAAFIHHISMPQPVRYNLGRKRIKAGDLFEGNEAICIAIAWEEETDAEGPGEHRLGICRLMKSELLAGRAGGQGVDFLPIVRHTHDWNNVDVRVLAWAGAGPRLFVGGSMRGGTGGRAAFGQVWDVVNAPDGLLLHQIHKEIRPSHRKAVTGAAISRDGQLLVTGGSDGRVFAHDLRGEEDNLKLLRTHATRGLGDERAHDGTVQAIAISRDGAKVFTASTGPLIKMWDTLTGEEIAGLVGHTSGVRDLQVSRGGKRLFSFGFDGTARSWDVSAKAPAGRAYSVSDRPVFLTYVGEHEVLCADSSGKLWRCHRNRPPQILTEFGFRVANGCVILPEAREQDLPRICVVGRGKIGIFNPRRENPSVIELPRTSRDKESAGTGVCAIGNDRVLIGLDDGRLLELTVAASGIHHLEPMGGELGTQVKVLLHLSTGLVLCGRSDSRISLWSNQRRMHVSEHRLPTGVRHARTLAAVELPLLGLIATAGGMGRRYEIVLWERDSMRHWDRLEGHTAQVETLAVLSDGRTLISAGRDCVVNFWDVVGRVHLGSIRAFPDWITRMTVSPSGEVIATGEAEVKEPIIREWGAVPFHYGSIDWKAAVGENYAGPAFVYGSAIIQELRPDGLPEETRRRYFLEPVEHALPAGSEPEEEEDADETI